MRAEAVARITDLSAGPASPKCDTGYAGSVGNGSPKLCSRPRLAYAEVLDELGLPSERERPSAAAAAEGRYRDRAEVVAAGVALLRERDAARTAFLASVLAAEAEAEREGCVSGEEMLARIRSRLADKLGCSL